MPALVDPEADPCAGVHDGACAPMSREGAPSPRIDEAIVWTGSELLVWGGCANVGGEYRLVADGGRYDPETDRWRPITRLHAPSPRARPLALFTSAGLLVWGGEGHRDGAIWDPATNTWRALPALERLPPPVMPRARALTIGDRVLLWPDRSDVPVPITAPGFTLDPTSGRVEPIASAPVRVELPAIGIGPSSILVFGGYEESPAHPSRAGSLYAAADNAWHPVAANHAPSARYGASAFFDAPAFVVRAGMRNGAALPIGDGAAYEPATGAWRALDPGLSSARPASSDGSRRVPFDYGGHYVLGPDFLDLFSIAGYGSTVRGPDPGGVPRDLALDDRGATSTVVIGRIGGALWVATRDLTRTWRMPDSGAWEPVRDALAPASMAGRSWRVVWTGTRLLAWGGLRETGSEPYDCSAPCPEGAPCAEQICTRRTWAHHLDGLVYTPPPR